MPERADARRRRTRIHRAEAHRLKPLICRECGLEGDGCEYHHLDPSSKSFNVAQYFGRVRWERIQVELEKCEVLCRTCHQFTFGKENGDIPF